jgi:hypothetical protein
VLGLLAGEVERPRGREEVSLETLREILSHLSYRNCSFVCGTSICNMSKDPIGLKSSFWLQVQYPVVEKGVARTAFARRWIVEPDSTPWQIVATAFKAVLTVEEHEARESFLYKGAAVFYPHHDLEELVELRHKEISARGSSEAEDKVS